MRIDIEKKTVAIVKQKYLEKAERMFKGTEIVIRVDGGKYLGVGIGTEEYRRNYLKEKVQIWIQHIEKISEYTEANPHECYSCLTKSLVSSWRFVLRTMGCFSDELEELDKAIDQYFIKTLLHHDPDHIERLMISMPCREGGLGIPILQDL